MKLIDVGRDEKCTAVSNLGRRDKINKRMNANVKKKKQEKRNSNEKTNVIFRLDEEIIIKRNRKRLKTYTKHQTRKEIKTRQ
jgi:maltodextrin utilization protein YvdJ